MLFASPGYNAVPGTGFVALSVPSNMGVKGIKHLTNFIGIYFPIAPGEPGNITLARVVL